MQNVNKENNWEDLVKNSLAEHLGTDVEDISETDSFFDDLNMRTTDLSDFFEVLTNKGINMSKINLSEIDTVGGLIEKLSSEEDF
ncbi:hypothetical protein A2Z22_00155 [Candidatus Woesebacteria bacterium RBG_16_34_12]|uniref:Carrier domain-containing protein n=1 Tax=Candidatus Woesebacteria bacterium RBG_16_34_12 TaxID=1802480 RepID=A0A1F7XAP1_9BACT|nr:MAG: hypothetical protein A2Z22_00155 [Candidatus Woesebacteria bacterium RBG_16_34_12]